MRLIVTILAVAILGLSLLTGYQFYRANKATAALCVLRHDLQARVQRSEQYLVDVAVGNREPIAGVTTADINDSISNQQRTIRALSVLDCN